MLAPTDEKDYALKVKAQVAMREYALRRMWFVIASLTVAATYTLVYSLMLKGFADPVTC